MSRLYRKPIGISRALSFVYREKEKGLARGGVNPICGVADIDFDMSSTRVVVFGGLVLQLLAKLLLSFRNNVYSLYNFV